MSLPRFYSSPEQRNVKEAHAIAWGMIPETKKSIQKLNLFHENI